MMSTLCNLGMEYYCLEKDERLKVDTSFEQSVVFSDVDEGDEGVAGIGE